MSRSYDFEEWAYDFEAGLRAPVGPPAPPVLPDEDPPWPGPGWAVQLTLPGFEDVGRWCRRIGPIG